MKVGIRISTRIVIAAMVFLAGCAVQGREFKAKPIPNEKALIYVYRPYSVLGAVLIPTVNCGENGIAIGPGGYHPFTVTPGTISCNAHTEATSEVEIEARPGEEYYVKEDMGVGFFIGRPHLSTVEPEIGRSQIQACKLQ
jgi:hypothetical protein